MSLINQFGKEKKTLSQEFFNSGRCNKIIVQTDRKIIFMRIENRLKAATLRTHKIKLQCNIL